MGAAVLDNGQASGALKRRVDSAIAINSRLTNARFIVTGGIGKNKFSEAEVMSDLLIKSNIKDNRIIIEDKSIDTLDSIINCTNILKKDQNFSGVIISSDIYHIPRCRWLFYLVGIKTIKFNVISGLKANGKLKWLYYYVREFVAFPYDTVMILLKKLK